MGIIELNSKVQDLRELKRMADELNAEIESLTDAIKAEMVNRNVEELNGCDWRITWKLVKTRHFNTKAFQRAHTELYDQYCSESATRRFMLA